MFISIQFPKLTVAIVKWKVGVVIAGTLAAWFDCLFTRLKIMRKSMGHIKPSFSSTWTESMATSKQISINHSGRYAFGSVHQCEEHGQT